VHAAVTEFNEKTIPRDWSSRNLHGAWVGEKFDPIGRVGIYVPGGKVPLVSTVLMTATLARIAGCPEIAVFTPSGADGSVAPDLLAALDLVGVREVYRIGGVQAIGAMAFGTQSIPSVDKVFGPGNAYVCEAKRRVFGLVGVDLLPGPSELMVIADDSARLDFAAADLLAQAEHGSGREKIYLVATSAKVVSGVAAEVERQLDGLARSDQVRKVLANGFLAVVVPGLAEAAVVANRVAPEHLELLVRDGSVARLVKRVTTAGAIMIGNSTPTALGDFAAGPSHVLPTGGAARFSSGLRVADFLRRTSVLRYDPKSVRRAEPTVAALSAMEGLGAHGRSAAVRVPRAGAR
jgi:histidinol dehydrogenase